FFPDEAMPADATSLEGRGSTVRRPDGVALEAVADRGVVVPADEVDTELLEVAKLASMLQAIVDAEEDLRRLQPCRQHFEFERDHCQHGVGGIEQAQLAAVAARWRLARDIDVDVNTSRCSGVEVESGPAYQVMFLEVVALVVVAMLHALVLIACQADVEGGRRDLRWPGGQ